MGAEVKRFLWFLVGRRKAAGQRGRLFSVVVKNRTGVRRRGAPGRRGGALQVGGESRLLVEWWWAASGLAGRGPGVA